MKKLILLFLVNSLVTACTSTYHKPSDSVKINHSSSSYSPKSVIKSARAMLGVKYHFGGVSPKTGFDCSGLVYYAHNKQGIKLPRSTRAQLKSVNKVTKSSLRPGDLVFFAINHRKVSHVGIYLGNNKFIHSPSTGKKVNITSMDSNYWRSRFVIGGRI